MPKIKRGYVQYFASEYDSNGKIVVTSHNLQSKTTKICMRYMYMIALSIAVVILMVGIFIQSDIYKAVQIAISRIYLPLSVNDIVISGNIKVNDIILKDCLHSNITKDISILSSNAIKQKILSECNDNNAIRDASVVVQLPHKIFIEIKEFNPIAIWKKDDIFVFIDEAGKVVNIAPSEDDMMYYVIAFGDGGDIALTKLMQIMDDNQARGRLSIVEISHVHFVEMRRWDIFLIDGKIIKLPEENIQTAINMLYNISNDIYKKAKVIDLRLSPNKIFIEQ